MAHPRRVGASLVALCVATLAGGRTADAQSILGPGESALTVPRGVVRTSILIDLARYDERFSVGGKAEPLGTDFSVDALGARQLPSLLAAQQNLSTLTGQPAVTLSLGRLFVTEDARVTTIPLQVELGVTRWLTLVGVMPIVRTRNTVSLATGDDATAVNAAVNPQLETATQAAALAANQRVLSQVRSARDSLQNTFTRCQANAGSSSLCPGVLANPSQTQALIDAASVTETALAQTYGGGSETPSSFVPLIGSALQAAVDARLATLSTSFDGYIGTSGAITDRPAAALGPLTGAQAQAAFATDFFNADPIRSIDRIGIGDMEVGAKILLLDAVSGSASTKRGPIGLRLAVAPIFRIGTAGSNAPFNWFDIPLGDGQNDVEVRGYADVLLGRHLWASFIGRYTWQLKDVEIMRIIDTPSDVYAPAFREREVTRDLGDYFELEARPRYVINAYAAISGMYLYRHKREDSYTGQYLVPASETGGLGDVTLDASTMNAETEAIEHRVGAGLTFSSVPAFARGRARIPVEVSVLHLQSVRGFGGRTPKQQSDQVQVRFYTRIFGASPETTRGKR